MSNVYPISPWIRAGAAAWVPCDIPAHAAGLIVAGNSGAAPEAIRRGRRWRLGAVDNRGELDGEICANQCDRGDDGDRDQRGNETIPDCRVTNVILGKAKQKGFSSL
jgi:hypothetical protein